MQGPDGRLFLGGQNGVTAFSPQDFWADWNQENGDPLEAYQLEIGLDGDLEKTDGTNLLGSAQAMELESNTRSLHFKLRCSNYFLADKVKYVYRMEEMTSNDRQGFESDWVEGMLVKRYKRP